MARALDVREPYALISLVEINGRMATTQSRPHGLLYFQGMFTIVKTARRTLGRSWECVVFPSRSR